MTQSFANEPDTGQMGGPGPKEEHKSHLPRVRAAGKLAGATMQRTGVKGERRKRNAQQRLKVVRPHDMVGTRTQGAALGQRRSRKVRH